MDDVEQTAPRKRGGQPGNRNAVKTGRHTAALKAQRRLDWTRVRALRSLSARARAIASGIMRQIEERQRVS